MNLTPIQRFAAVLASAATTLVLFTAVVAEADTTAAAPVTAQAATPVVR